MQEDILHSKHGSQKKILAIGKKRGDNPADLNGSQLGVVQESEEEDPSSQELKKLRLRISDFSNALPVDAICQKVSEDYSSKLQIWRLVIPVQYDEILMELVQHPCALPIDSELYFAISALF